MPDAGIDASKKDEKDLEIGIVGYDIPFNRLFYKFDKLRSLDELDLEISNVTKQLLSHLN